MFANTCFVHGAHRNSSRKPAADVWAKFARKLDSINQPCTKYKQNEVFGFLLFVYCVFVLSLSKLSPFFFLTGAFSPSHFHALLLLYNLCWFWIPLTHFFVRVLTITSTAVERYGDEASRQRLLPASSEGGSSGQRRSGDDADRCDGERAGQLPRGRPRFLVVPLGHFDRRHVWFRWRGPVFVVILRLAAEKVPGDQLGHVRVSPVDWPVAGQPVWSVAHDHQAYLQPSSLDPHFPQRFDTHNTACALQMK